MSKKNDFTKTVIWIYFLFFITVSNMALAAPYDRSTYPGSAISKSKQYEHLMGMTTGVGYVRTENDQQGNSIYANFTMFWFNFSLEYQHFDDRSTINTYTGLGLGRYLQVQYGYGDEGYIVRMRSELEVVNQFTVFIAKERYPENPAFDSYSFGIGYNF